MKNVFFTALIFFSFLSLQSCKKTTEEIIICSGIPSNGLFFFINKNSQEYNDLLEAFSKEDYNNEPTEERGYNNIYFLINGKKIKITHEMSSYSPTYKELYSIMPLNIGEDYAFFHIGGLDYKFYLNVFTEKEENFSFVYGNHTMKLTIKGNIKLIGGFYKPTVEDFYVNDKAHRFITKKFRSSIEGSALFLTE